MAQQINLFSPILLTPRRYFSALAMVQALGVLVLGLVAAGTWATLSAGRTRAELGAAVAAGDAQKRALAAAVAAQPAASASTTALEQELVQARRRLAQQRAVLAEMGASAGQGQAALLQLLARTAPDTLWLTDVRRGAGRIDLQGVALQPAALNPWLARLAADPLLADARPRIVHVERASGDAADGWRFRILAGPDAGDAR